MSDKWKKRSIDLANNQPYLDMLQDSVYDMQPPEDRNLPDSEVERARDAYSEKNFEELVKAFIEFEKFPYSDTYAAFLRHADGDEAFKNNPETVERIGRRIHNMGIEKALARSSRPKESNRQMGGKFEEWFLNLDYKYLSYNDFKERTCNVGELVVMKEGESKIGRYVNEELDVKIDKEPDLLVKKNIDGTQKHIVGEAKFLTGFGGHQDRQISDALNLAETADKYDNVIGIAIIDGVYLIEIRKGLDRKYQNKIRNTDAPVMSALLLRDFLDSL